MENETCFWRGLFDTNEQNVLQEGMIATGNSRVIFISPGDRICVSSQICLLIKIYHTIHLPRKPSNTSNLVNYKEDNVRRTYTFLCTKLGQFLVLFCVT